MSTNIDDISDPHITQTPTTQVDLQQKSFNTNITSNVLNTTSQPVVTHQPVTITTHPVVTHVEDGIAHEQHSKNLYHTALSETNLLAFVMIILASLPQGNILINKIIPNKFHNSIVINIIKAIILFILYILIIQFIL